MPEIKIDRVVSVSSEDNKFSAANLLGPPGSGKWKAAAPGEKKISVILQFQKPSKITSIHVGNDSTAFVEVLAGKESASSDQDWKVLLVASSLMTPADARSDTNTQKVRLFGTDSLSKSALDDKWDRVKVICTQPFNRSIAHGLSFITFLNNEDEEGETEAKASSAPQKLGGFTLNEDTDSDSAAPIAAGSMFSERARLQADPPPPTAAAAVRAAARVTDTKVGVSTSPRPPQTSKVVKAEAKPDTKAKPSPSPKPDKKDTKQQPNTTQQSKAKNKEPTSVSKPNAQSSRSSDISTPTHSKAASKPAATATPPPPPAALKDVMKGVVFSLSGYKNPKRSDLREKGIEMGARYCPDWTKSCTHLICAFQNTPKFGQVNGKGYIVTEDWILDSHKQKTKLPWRNYRMGRSQTPPLDKVDTAKAKAEEEARNRERTDDKTSKTVEEKDSVKRPAQAAKGAAYEDSTDVDSDVDEPPTKKGKASAGPELRMAQESQDTEATDVDSMDTDDEIAAHIAKANSPNKGKAPASGKPGAVKASAPGPSSTKSALPVLPDFLLNKTFFLYGTVNDRRKVYRYVFAYGGDVADYMCDEVKYVVTDDEWDDNFDSALNDNPNLIFVKSKWIMEIHTKQKYVPHQKFAVVPN